MSGIAGLYHPGHFRVREDLAKMTQALVHRGLDVNKMWAHECVGLAGSTRDITSGSPPLASRCGNLALVADVRLDNREQLMSKLGLEGRDPARISDGDVILGAYLLWGEGCPEHLVGDFAFALWDGQRQRLFCARDHLGVRPFYYTQWGNSFAFASEMKALLALPWAPRQLNETRVADYLTGLLEDQEATFYQGILRLPPAHTLSVSPEGLRLRRYWSLDPQREIRYASDEEYAESYRELFLDAVRCRIRSSRPVGTFLSGGLDSSSVTGVARASLAQESRLPLDTFSLVFDQEPRCDERPYIEAVLAQGGLRAHYVPGDELDQLPLLEPMLQQVEEPFFTPNLFLYWELYRAAQAQGVGVVLDGFLGDNVVSHGSRYLTELAATGRWVQLLREVQTVARVLGGRRRHGPRLLQEFVVQPLVVEPLQRAWFSLARPEVPPGVGSRFINRGFARRTGCMERAREFGKDLPRTPHQARAEHYAELTSGALPGVLETANKAAAAFGVTPCYPFADRRLMEFCLAVPVTQKYRDGWTRVMPHQAMRDFLPDAVFRRYGKTSLHRVFHRSLFRLGEGEMDRLVFHRLPLVKEWVNVASVQQAYREVQQDYRQGRQPRDGGAVLGIWYAVILTRWLAGVSDGFWNATGKAGVSAAPGAAI